MGVFGVCFGCRGDVGFSGPLLEVSSGVVGFNVAALSRLVREKVRPAWSDGGRERENVCPARSKWPKFSVLHLLGEYFRGNAGGGAALGEFFRANRCCARSCMRCGALQAGCGGGFAALGAGYRRVAGVLRL